MLVFTVKAKRKGLSYGLPAHPKWDILLHHNQEQTQPLNHYLPLCPVGSESTEQDRFYQKLVYNFTCVPYNRAL